MAGDIEETELMVFGTEGDFLLGNKGLMADFAVTNSWFGLIDEAAGFTFVVLVLVISDRFACSAEYISIGFKLVAPCFTSLIVVGVEATGVVRFEIASGFTTVGRDFVEAVVWIGLIWSSFWRISWFDGLVGVVEFLDGKAAFSGGLNVGFTESVAIYQEFKSK